MTHIQGNAVFVCVDGLKVTPKGAVDGKEVRVSSVAAASSSDY